MKEYKTTEIRNIAILGHQGSGKTSLTEAMLSISGAIAQKGEIERRTTAADPEARSSLVAIEWKDSKLNFFDLPGNEEFIGEIENVLAVVDGVVLVIDATKGVEVGTERAWEEIHKRKLPCIIFVNKMDKENIKYAETIASIKIHLSKNATSFALPMGVSENYKGTINVVSREAYKAGVLIDMPEEKKADVEQVYGELMELAASQDESLLTTYLDTMELGSDDVRKGLNIGTANGDIFPILPGSASKNMGIRTILDYAHNYIPAADKRLFEGTDEVTRVPLEIHADATKPLLAYVFKTTIDNYVGQINYLKILQGTLSLGDEAYLPSTDDVVKLPALFTMQGKAQFPVDHFQAGDIACVAKVSAFYNGLAVCSKKVPLSCPKVTHPTPIIYVAIAPANKKDEDKLMTSLQRIQQEDETFEIKRNPETSQLLIGGQGMTQLQSVIQQMKDMFKVDIITSDPKVVYRETIRTAGSAEGRHKKQTGGAGQFGDVWMRFEPSDKEYEFAEEVFGGSVPRNYYPAVEKGTAEAVQHGPLAGFPLIGVRAVLYDGSYHPVDSNEISFKIAAQLAYKNAMPKCNPTILEPIMKIQVTVKGDFVGAVMGDLTKRRGRILNIASDEGKQVVIAEVPEAEIITYAIDLKAMTQASGHFSREFLRYDPVPENLIAKIVASAKADQEQ